MKIPKTVVVGSTNRTKIEAIHQAVADHEVLVISCEADTRVKHQPLSQEETIEGALSRARDSLVKTNVEVAFGLEGGVCFMVDRIQITTITAKVLWGQYLYYANL